MPALNKQPPIYLLPLNACTQQTSSPNLPTQLSLMTLKTAKAIRCTDLMLLKKNISTALVQHKTIYQWEKGLVSTERTRRLCYPMTSPQCVLPLLHPSPRTLSVNGACTQHRYTGLLHSLWRAGLNTLPAGTLRPQHVATGGHHKTPPNKPSTPPMMVES